MKKKSITIRLPSDVMDAVIALAERKKCSKTLICREGIETLVKTKDSFSSIETLHELVNITSLSLSTIARHYRTSKTAKRFWDLVISPRTNGTIFSNVKGQIYVKFKDHKKYIFLPQTGNYSKDIEDGTKNIVQAIRVLTNPLCEEEKTESYDDFCKKGMANLEKIKAEGN